MLTYAPPIRVSPPPTYVVPPHIINNVATTAQQRQQQCAGRGAPERVTFGPDTIGAYLLWKPFVWNRFWVFGCYWGYGPIEAVDEITICDQAAPTGTQITHYLGTPDQTVDAGIATAFAAQGLPVFADAMPNRAWSKVLIPINSTSSFPVCKAKIRGMKIYDDRTHTTVYTKTPGLALAEFCRNTDWGEGKIVTGMADVADFNETLIGTSPHQEAHREIGLTLNLRQASDAWRETLRTYAGCLCIPEAGGYRLVPDAPSDVAMTFEVGGTANNVIALGEIRIAGKAQLPTAFRVGYTNPDTGADEWTPYFSRPGVQEWRPMDVRLPGVRRYSQARREAIETGDKLWLCDLEVDIPTTDIGLKAVAGSVIAYTDPRGLTAKQLRVLRLMGERGRLKLSCKEYDPAAYNLDVVAEPSTPDYSGPQPNNPPTPTNIAVVERNYTMQDGSVSTRFEAACAAVEFPFPMQYLWKVRTGGVDVYTSLANSTSYASGPLQEGLIYSVSVAVVSMSVGQTGVSADWAGMAQGDLIPPSPVTGLRAYEAAGETFISHNAVVDKKWDSTEYRITAYNGAHDADWHWERGQLVDFNPAPSAKYATKQIPSGTWMLTAKGHDRARTDQFFHGQESVNAAGVQLVVTSDANSFLVDHIQYTAFNTTNMTLFHYPLPTDNEWVSSAGTAWNTMFPGAMNAYTNAVPTYYQPSSSEGKTEVVDHGMELTGNWSALTSVLDIAGTAIVYIGLSATGAPGTFTEYPDGSCKASGRFSYVRIYTTGSMVIDEYPQLRVDAVATRTVYTITTSATGPVTVTLDGHYLKIKEVTPTSQGSAAAFPKAENFYLHPTNPNTFECRSINAATFNLIADTVQVVVEAIKAD